MLIVSIYLWFIIINIQLAVYNKLKLHVMANFSALPNTDFIVIIAFECAAFVRRTVDVIVVAQTYVVQATSGEYQYRKLVLSP